MKSIIVTGATGSIGFECAKNIAHLKTDQQLIITSRDMTAGNNVVKKIQQQTNHKHIICLPLALDSLQSIKEFAELIATKKIQVSALINNAGIQVVGKTDYTKDGFEETFGVNHLGTLYLTLLLLPHLTNDARITFTASGTHDPKQPTGMPPAVFSSVKELAFPQNASDISLKTGQLRYTTTKLCNVLTTYELQKRLANTEIKVNAFDPGYVPGTGLARNYPAVIKFLNSTLIKLAILLPINIHSAKTSGKRLAKLAIGVIHSNAKGKYFEGEKEIKSSVDSYNQFFQKSLWEESIKLVGISQNETTIFLT